MAQIAKRGNEGLGGKRRKFSLTMREDHYDSLTMLSAEAGKSISLLVDDCLEHYLHGKALAMDRESEQEKAMESSDQGVSEEHLNDIYVELETMLGMTWLDMTELQRRVMAWLALFPHEDESVIAKLADTTKKQVKRMKLSELGIQLVNHFGDRNLRARRPTIYHTIANKVEETNDPAYAQILTRVYGDEKIRNINSNSNTNVSLSFNGEDANGILTPAEVDLQIMKLANKVNMTPKRFEALYAATAPANQLLEETSGITNDDSTPVIVDVEAQVAQT